MSAPETPPTTLTEDEREEIEVVARVLERHMALGTSGRWIVDYEVDPVDLAASVVLAVRQSATVDAETLAVAWHSRAHNDGIVPIPDAPDPRNRIAACYECQRVAAEVLASGVVVRSASSDDETTACDDGSHHTPAAEPARGGPDVTPRSALSFALVGEKPYDQAKFALERLAAIGWTVAPMRSAAEPDGLREAVEALADEMTAEIEDRREDTPSDDNGWPITRAHFVGFTAGLGDARDRLRAVLAAHPATDAGETDGAGT